MADTIREELPNEECSDCGVRGTTFKHWGSLVRPRDVGRFCVECMNLRRQSNKVNENAEPLGYRKMAIEAKGLI